MIEGVNNKIILIKPLRIFLDLSLHLSENEMLPVRELIRHKIK